MKKLALLTIFVTLNVVMLFSQCTNQVMHMEGTMSVNGILVTVNSTGFVDFNTGYCPTTLPYFVGYNYNLMSSGNGTFSFSFSPPVSAATLNFSGISNNSGGSEEVRVYVNGDHFAIPAPGTSNGCDDLAVLTSQGNIAGCQNCTVSGWMGTDISGPVYTLMVEDTVMLGEPAGAIFSLFICDSIATGEKENKFQGNFQVIPNPFIDQAILHFPQVSQKAMLTLYNSNGQLVRKMNDITGDQVMIKRDGLVSGFYYFVLQTDDQILATGKIIAK